MNALQTSVFFLAITLQGDDGNLPDLLKALDSPDAKVRLRAAIDIGNLPLKPKSAVPVLFARLKSEKSPEVRAQFLSTISGISFWGADKKPRPLEEIDEKILRKVAAYLGDESDEVRAMAASCLVGGRQKSKFAVPKLIDAVKDEHFNVKNGAIRCLLVIGPDAAPALPLLRMELATAKKALKDEEHPLRKKYPRAALEAWCWLTERAIRAIENKAK